VQRQQDAQLYHNHAHYQHTTALRCLHSLALAGYEYVLDIGCRDGEVTALLSECVPQGKVIGIDNSEAMIHFAEQTHPPAKYPHLFFGRVDPSHLAYQEQFDVVVSFYALQWLSNQADLLHRIYASLKPSGHFHAVLALWHGLEESIQQVADSQEWKKWFASGEIMSHRPYFHQWDTDEYRALLKQAHFAEHHVTRREDDWMFADQEEFKQWLTSWLPLPTEMPWEKRDLFIKELLNQYLATHSCFCSDNRHLVVHLDALHVRAHKKTIPTHVVL
jgi:trans-aconitate 2-methyltransferase